MTEACDEALSLLGLEDVPGSEGKYNEVVRALPHPAPPPRRRRRGGGKRISAEAARRAVSNREGLLLLYDTHFFPHVNVDMLRLRFYTRSLLTRVSAEFASCHQDTGRSAEYSRRRICTLLARNRCRTGDEDYCRENSIAYSEYCMHAFVHMCEYIICKTEGLLYETTDAYEAARRAMLRRGVRDVCSLETAILSAVGWRIWAAIDEMSRIESISDPDFIVVDNVRIPRYVEMSSLRKLSDIYDQSFVPFQTGARQGAEALLTCNLAALAVTRNESDEETTESEND